MSEKSDTADSTLPDTAMATGNDQGEFGHPDTRPLAEDERKLLKKLQKGKGQAEAAVEDSPEVAAAVADDAPLLSDQVPGGNDDGLDARFTDR